MISAVLTAATQTAAVATAAGVPVSYVRRLERDAD